MTMNRAMMRRLAALCLLAVVALPLAGRAAPATPSFPKLNARVIDSYVLPRFKRLADTSGKLAEDLARACDGDKKAARVVKRDFTDTVLAWAAVEFLRFGPMSQIGRPERFDFSPDPRGVTQRQVGALVAKRDAAALDPAMLAKKSAAVQGLSALEVLLYDDARPIAGDDDDARYRCKLAQSMAQSTNALAREVLAEWEGDTGWRARMIAPPAGDTRYKAPEEPAGDFARALITGLQMIQDREVAPMIAAVATPDKLPRLPFARSGLSARYIASGIASAKALYEAMDLARIAPSDKAWMPRWITAAFERLARDGPAAVESLPQAKDNPNRARDLRMVRFHVEGIRKLVGRELAPAAGLMIGFNELDGD
jgi:predicted lipoprotein